MDERPAVSRRGVLAALGVGALAGCVGTDDPPPTPGPTDWVAYDAVGPAALDVAAPEAAPDTGVDVEPVVEGLEIPWDLDFDAAGNLYLTERTGRVLRFDSDAVEAVAEPADAIPAGTAEDGWWVEGGEGGTLGLAVAPDDAHVYVYYTAQVDGGVENRVVRYPIEADGLGAEEVVVEGIPADSRIHNGGRIAFGPDGHLWVTTGDAADARLSRSPASLAGKVLRVDADGAPAPDNPDHAGDDRVYAAGLRNPQGIDWVTDAWPVVTDHGPTGLDAISLLYPGGDHGWDDVRSPADGDGYGRYGDHPEIVPPLALADPSPSWAPSGAAWYTGDAVPTWADRYVVGTLIHQRVLVVTLTPPGQAPPAGGATFEEAWTDQAATATIHEALVDELGRVRHVAQGPDGELYALTSNWDGRAEGAFPLDEDDRLVRIVPA